MKKLIVLLVCVFTLCLCACENQEQPPVTTDSKTESTEASTQSTAEATTVPDNTDSQPGTDLKALAETCIDKSVTELYALIGEPEASDYAKSCLGDGDDGNLYYDGFVVYTYREGEKETVRFVE